MILIAPDKYKGTYTANEAAALIRDACIKRIIPGMPEYDEILIVHMADGGEGTAKIIAETSDEWKRLDDGCYYNENTREFALDSASVVGHACFDSSLKPIERTTAPLAKYLNNIYYRFRPEKIYLGVGGTATCDGGRGLIENLSPDVDWRKIIIGLIDVKVPLLPEKEGDMSSLIFCPQKGFTPEDIPAVIEKLKAVTNEFGQAKSVYAGAGGGLGYALADIVGAKCLPGAEFLLDRADIPWEKVKMVFTGEGRYDSQTQLGKVVHTVGSVAQKHGVPTVCLAGCIEPGSFVTPGLKVTVLSEIIPDAKRILKS